MRGDPTPVCLSCGEYLGGSHRIQVPDGRLICIRCYHPAQRDAVTWLEVDAAIESIKRAGRGQV